MKVIKGLILGLFVALPLSGWAEEGNPSAEQRYEAVEQRISQACLSEPQGDLCQVYLHGLLQGVQSTGVQVEKLAAGWARLHEQADRRHPFAWLARDILHAASCTPDALAFLDGFSGVATGQAVSAQANAYVAKHCQPVWAQHRLEAPSSAHTYFITQR